MKQHLSAERILPLRRGAAQKVDVLLAAETESTNTDLLKLLKCDLAPTLLIARKQTAGRGRSGRIWYSEMDASLTFSIAWKFPGPVQKLMGLPLVVGVALVEVLAMHDVYVQLKWPNDVVKKGEKLAGILIETAVVDEPNKANEWIWAVIGVGLNLEIPEGLEEKIDQPAADAPWLARVDRSELMASLLNVICEALVLFEHSGFAPFMARWNGLHAYANQRVRILDRGRIIQEGRALGVDASGYLMLETDAGIVPVLAGDVSLRAVEGA